MSYEHAYMNNIRVINGRIENDKRIHVCNVH
jgi:hypothetical protein